MAKTHFIREWRNFRGLSQDQVGQLVSRDHSSIGKLENGKTRYTEETLIEIAKALRVTPGELLDIDPTTENLEFLQEIKLLTPDQRRRATGLLRAFRESDSIRPTNDRRIHATTL